MHIAEKISHKRLINNVKNEVDYLVKVSKCSREEAVLALARHGRLPQEISIGGIAKILKISGIRNVQVIINRVIDKVHKDLSLEVKLKDYLEFFNTKYMEAI